MIRTLFAIAAALLLAVQVVRSAAVASLAERRPDLAATYWPDHPATEVSRGMTEIALAARKGTPVPPSAFAQLREAARREPLAPEPFMVRGVQAQLAGDTRTAQRAFEAAQRRDPRSRQAAYFLSDHYLRSGNAKRGLEQIALLARLSDYGPGMVAPYLATYAAAPANRPAMRRFFASNPDLALPALKILAADVQRAPTILELVDPREVRGAPWLPNLLNSLVTAGDPGRARAVWAQATGVRGAELVHDAEFADKESPPPFNWELTSSAVGLAERLPGGRLHILYYGQEDGTLAAQMLLLKPGPYRLSLQLLGDTSRAKALNWSIWCDKVAAPISSVSLDQAVRGWSFVVPSACPAQWLKLTGSSGDLPQQLDVTIARLKVERLGPSA